MNKHERDEHVVKSRTNEERRFILWSIARANRKPLPGPYLNEGARESHVQATAQPNNSRHRRRVLKQSSRKTKRPQVDRASLLRQAALAGQACGAMIGLNAGMLVFFAPMSITMMTLVMVLAMLVGGLLGNVLSRGILCGRSKTTDQPKRIVSLWP